MKNSQASFFRKTFSNSLGFSLLEVVVVGAIIAVLSLVAVPAYKSYVARARRAEGWNLMNSYYSASIAAKAEFGDFPGNFVQLDFQPVGELGYRITAVDGPDASIALNDNACVDTTQTCDCGGGCVGFKIWVDTGLGTQGIATLGPQPPAGGACGPVAALNTTANTFSIRASGRISAEAANIDTLGLDELKTMQVCVNGAQ